MAQISLQAAESPARVAVRETTRLYFLDHWRAALTALVVLHHLAVVYSAAAPYYYVDPPQGESLGGLALFVFVLFNQAWFMGAFFLLAGYFTPGSFARKGPEPFLKDRLLRLGIPLAVFMFVLGPLSDAGLFLDPAPLIPLPLTWQNYWPLYRKFIGLGVAWFLALLLVFSLGYVVWRRVTGDRPAAAEGLTSLPGYLGIGLFVGALALASYLLRMVIPMGKTIWGFPTLAYLPEYLSFFIIGTIAYRGDWLRKLPGSMGAVGFVAALAASILLFPAAIMSIFTRGEALFLGNGTWQSAAYALWDAIFAVGMCLAMITFFRRFFNKQSNLGSFLAQQSYAVYIIHSPIVVVLAYALYLAYLRAGAAPGPFLKFCIASVLIVPVCFAAAYLIRRIPGVSRIL